MKSSQNFLSRQERDEAIEIEAHLYRSLMKKSFPDFVQDAWKIIEPKTEFVYGWHIDAISEHLVALHNLEIRNLIINIPPRHMKSSLVCVLFPAWIWLTNPGAQWLFSTYSASLSKRDSVKCRRIIESQWYASIVKKEWSLASDQNEKMRFDNTKEGYRLATSVGGAATGYGGDWIVADDPHNAKEIHSKTKRKAVISWWDEAMSSRGNNPKTFRKLIIMQRLHRDDLTGHALEQGGYEHLMLPAEYEPRICVTGIGWSDPRVSPGEPLWPQRFGKEEIASLKLSLGRLAAAGQLQQSPTLEDGSVIRRHHIKFYKELPGKIDLVGISCDLASAGGDKSDFSVIQVWGRCGADKYLIHQVRDRMAFTQEAEAIRMTRAAYPSANFVLVEQKANGFAVIDYLKKEIPGIVPFNPKTSKEERLIAVSPQFEAGNIYYPDPSIAPWVHDNIEELVGFPNEKNDDTCFAAGTKILTLFGQKPIEKIKNGDIVITPFGPRRVLRAWQTGVSEVIDKFGILATPNHPTYSTIRKKFVPIDAINHEELSVFSWNGLILWMLQRSFFSAGKNTSEWEEFENIISRNQQKTAKEKEQKDCTLRFGRPLIKKRLKKAITFITSITTNSIIILATFVAFQLGSIVQCLSQQLRQLSLISIAFVRSLLGGTDRKREENGILSTQERLCSLAGALLLAVSRNHAKTNSNQNDLTPNFAATNAAREHGGGRGELGRVPVYNISVRGLPLYYANGALVHNCDATTQVLIYFQTRAIGSFTSSGQKRSGSTLSSGIRGKDTW